MSLNIGKLMNKKGQTEIVVGSILLIVMILIGSVSSYKVISENRFVGDKISLKVYDLAKCDIPNIPKENRINFVNLEEALEKNYVLAEC